MPLALRKIAQSTVIFKAFSSDKKGAIAIMFAVSLVPILALFAFTVDYGIVSLTKVKLDAAADSAILAATVAAANTYVGNGGDFPSAKAAGIDAGQQWYSSQLQMAGFSINPTPPLPNIDIKLDNTTFNATLSYAATSPSYFGMFIGQSNYNLSGFINSTYTLPGYLDIIMMIDNSPSMAIVADLAKWPGYADYLYTRYKTFWKGPAQSTDCMFACHDVNTISDTSKTNTDLYYIAEEYARSVGINLLRIDVVGAAIQSVLQDVQATQASDHYRVGLYTFSDTVQQIFALGGSFKDAATAARTILPLASGSSTYRTDLSSAVSTMISNKYLTKAGDGLSAPNPKKILLLITDGVNDHSTKSNQSSSTGPVSPFDTAQCKKIKDLNIEIYVMYTKYYPVKRFYPGSSHPEDPRQSDWSNSTYVNQVMPFQSPTDQIQANLQSCASTPDKYYSVSDTGSINDAMKSILKAVLAQPSRFTQ